MEVEDEKKRPEKKLHVLDLKLLDLRVGLVTNVQPYSDENGSFLNIDIGKTEEKLAPTAGLMGHKYKLGKLIDKLVVVACNLPPVLEDSEEATTKVMCAVTEDKIEVLQPPKSAEPGDRVFAPGFTQDKFWILKQKNYEKVIVDLKVNDKGTVEYKGIPLKVEGRSGPITCKTLTNCQINHG